MTDPYYRRLQTGAHMFMHPCAVCGAEHAPFGFGVELRKGKPGVWLCREHKDKGDELAARQAKHESGGGRTAPRTVDEAAPLPAMGEARPNDGRTEGPQGKLFD